MKEIIKQKMEEIYGGTGNYFRHKKINPTYSGYKLKSLENNFNKIQDFIKDLGLTLKIGEKDESAN